MEKKPTRPTKMTQAPAWRLVVMHLMSGEVEKVLTAAECKELEVVVVNTHPRRMDAETTKIEQHFLACTL